VVPPNLLNRAFERSEPNEAWVGDATAIWTSTGWLYLAVLLDLFSRSVVGWATSQHNDTRLALTALERAVRRRKPPPGLLHHTDQGSPCASVDYRAHLERLGMVQSMSRTGDCWDNAVAESFFATLILRRMGMGFFREASRASNSAMVSG
jgi:transposase InsO family protein